MEGRHRGSGASIALSIVFGGVCLATIIYVAIRDKPVVDPGQFALLRVIAAIGAAGVGAILPGFLELKSKDALIGLRAGGALAVFALVYFADPVAAVMPKRACELNDTRTCLCAGDTTGVQHCSSSGSWERCECHQITLCEPGASRVCPCPSHVESVQYCGNNGTWQQCQCGTPEHASVENVDLAEEPKLGTSCCTPGLKCPINIGAAAAVGTACFCMTMMGQTQFGTMCN